MRPVFLSFVVSMLPALLLAQEAGEHQYEYDAANNLTSMTSSQGGETTITALPVDGSGRNRPSAIGATSLSWDRNGNLVGKGGQIYRYDYRNRLTQVLDSSETLLASYTYDALNRRVRRQVGSDLFETTWSGWQPVETYRNGKLQQRRTYGAGLDEAVRLEVDLNLDGVLDQTYVPIYDHSGNLALLTDESGKPVERYSYSPFGHQVIRVDSTAPEVAQVRVVGSALWISFSEEIFSSALEGAVDRGDLRVEIEGEAQPLGVALAERDEVLLPRRRFVISLDGGPPAVGAVVTLTLRTSVAVDFFSNRLTEDFVLDFAWPGSDEVFFDTEPPRVEVVRVREGVVEIDFTEPVTLSRAPGAITLDGVLSWHAESDGYRLVADSALAEGTHTLTVGTSLLDLANTALEAAFTRTLAADPAIAVQIVYREPDPRVTTSSAVGNTYGYHGHVADPETGLLYMRNRYYDPDMGRFISTDPMLYLDGPNPYQFSGNSPYNYRDPLGLYIVGSVQELYVLKQVLLKAGAADLAKLLRLERRSVPDRFRARARSASEERIAIIDTSRDWTKHQNDIARLIAAAIASDVRIEFNLSAADLANKSGAMTKSRGLMDVPYFEPDRPDSENLIVIHMNPEQILAARVKSYDEALATDVLIPVPLEAAVVHEFGHAYWMYGLRNTAPTQFDKKGTNEEAVRWENIYRTLIDLPLRAWH